MAEDMYNVIVPASRLQKLPDYKLYIRTLLHGQPQEPSLVNSFPPFPEQRTEATAEIVIGTSGRRYGRERKAVEDKLNRFLSAA